MRSASHEMRPDGDGLALHLAYRPPYDWIGLLGFLRDRAIPGVETVDEQSYRRTVELDGFPTWIEIRPLPGDAQVLLRMREPVAKSTIAAVGRVRRLLDLEVDPLAIDQHLRRDARLELALASHAGVRIPGAWDGFEIAVRAILGQQVTVKGATTLCGRLVRSFGVPIAEPLDGLTHLFPRPAALADADLSVIGVPKSRAAALRALACAVRSGSLSFELTDLDDLVTQLCALPGIGPWTAQYVAMRLGETDALPSSDLGVRRELSAGRLATPREVERRTEAWRPWRAYGVMLLWLDGATRRATRLLPG